MARIFLSYARDDGSIIANELANRLRSHDYQVFFDVQSIRAGTQWRSELSKRIKWSDVMVVLVTPASNDSDYVYKEVKEAANKGKMLIPIQVEDTPLPVHLRGTWQATRFKDDNYGDVLLEIERALKEIPHPSNRLSLYTLLAIAIVAVIAVAAFLILAVDPPPSDPTETEIAVVTDETAPSTDTPTSTNTPTDDSAFTPSHTPTITLTRTPRPTNTSRPTNTATSQPTEIPPELILFEENFEDGVANEFRPGAYHNWEVVEEADGNHSYLGKSSWIVNFGNKMWTNYAFSVSIKPLFQDSFFAVGFRSSGIPNANETHYFVGFEENQIVKLQKALSADVWDSLYEFTQTQLKSNEWNYLEVVVNDNLITVTFNDITSAPIYDYELSRGELYFVIHAGNSQILFDNVVVWSLEKN